MEERAARIRQTCKFGYGGYVFEIRYTGRTGGISVAYMFILPDINERIIWRLFWGSSVIEETL
eukprot:scaffold17786_cov50-Attheya_sp.AAC.1